MNKTHVKIWVRKIIIYIIQHNFYRARWQAATESHFNSFEQHRKNMYATDRAQLLLFYLALNAMWVYRQVLLWLWHWLHYHLFMFFLKAERTATLTTKTYIAPFPLLRCSCSTLSGNEDTRERQTGRVHFRYCWNTKRQTLYLRHHIVQYHIMSFSLTILALLTRFLTDSFCAGLALVVKIYIFGCGFRLIICNDINGVLNGDILYDTDDYRNHSSMVIAMFNCYM